MKKYVLPVPALIHVFQSWCTKNADPKKEVKKQSLQKPIFLRLNVAKGPENRAQKSPALLFRIQGPIRLKIILR